MGFFGDITKTAFQFDAVFSNRAEMDAAVVAGTDNIFSGHFVLVKYDPDGSFFEGNIGLGYYDNGAMYADSAYTQPLIYTTFTGPVNSPTIENWASYWYKQGDYYNKLPSQDYFNAEETNYYTAVTSGDNLTYQGQIIRARNIGGQPTQNYYYCSGGSEGSTATFSAVIDGENYTPYFVNYNIDKRQYNTDFDIRGYDATVWQKVYSEGHGKFILVAYLNGLVPAIELYADAPTTEPANAYIDNLSTDAVYRIHVPSNWGFRIKEAESEDDGHGNLVYTLSDQTIVQNYKTYNQNNEVIGNTNRAISAEIYFNKDGFVKLQRTVDSDTQNEILLTPTGESGKVYIDTNGTQVTVDTYELAIHLPVIGNIIADFYDLLYGYKESDGIEVRPTDTIWYNANDPRKDNGEPLLNGKTHDLNTVAGLINTFQDRLGQNIITLNDPITNVQVANLDSNYIYAVPSGDNSYLYYRIGTDYTYTPIPTQDITYTQVELTEEEYEPNTYYVKDLNNSNNYVIATETYNYYNDYPADKKFFQKNVSVIKFEEIELIGYAADTYYYQDAQYNYLKDMNVSVPTYKSQPYYTISAVNEVEYTFNYSYGANYFYKKLTDTRYILAEEAVPDLLITYYNISATSVSDGEKILYQPGKYYYYASYDNGQPVGSPILETNESITSGRIYYYIPLSSQQEYIIVDGQVYVGHALDVANKQQVTLFQPDIALSSIYIYQNNIYIPANEIEDLTIAYEYYSLDIDTVDNYFLPYEYYRKEENNYYLQDHWSGDPNTVYYKLVNLQPLAHPFYEGNKYYYNNGNIYLIDTGVSMTVDRTYYIGTSLYVYNDSSGRWPYGFEWQEQAVFVPASVTLATRTKIKKAFEISGINNGESSINGAILAFNNFAAFNDNDTRDHSTLTGSVNAVNDLLQSVKTNLIPGRVLYVNDFGQIAVSSIKISDLETLVASLSE